MSHKIQFSLAFMPQLYKTKQGASLATLVERFFTQLSWMHISMSRATGWGGRAQRERGKIEEKKRRDRREGKEGKGVVKERQRLRQRHWLRLGRLWGRGTHLVAPALHSSWNQNKCQRGCHTKQAKPPHSATLLCPLPRPAVPCPSPLLARAFGV